VFVHCKEMEASLSLSCTAPTAATATAIEQALSEYLAPPAQMFLVPPWARDDGRGADERAQHERARRTYLALQNAAGPSPDAKELVELNNAIGEAQKQGDHDQVARLRKAAREKREQARQAALQKVRDDPQSVSSVVERYVALGGDRTRADFLSKSVAELGPLMGQLPLVDGKPAPSAIRYSVRHGYVLRNEATVSLLWLGFHDLFDGPEALLGWLSGKGCSQFKYSIQSGPSRSDVDNEEEAADREVP
jgi:hypothetical protein